MYKLKIVLVNGTAPLDFIAFTGEKVKEISVEYLDDFNIIIDQATDFLNTIEGANKTIVRVRVTREDGGMVLDGFFKDGQFVSGTAVA